MVLAVAILMQGVNGDLESVRRTIDYLIRHQAEDGSWGRRPASCSCPLEPPGEPPTVDERTRARIAALIAGLSDDDPDARNAAGRALIALGPAALPQVRDAGTSDDVEIRARCRSVIQALQGALTVPGLELTAFALYLINEAGYHSQWPRREGEPPIGDVLARGQAWLLARQDSEGGFGKETPSATAIAAVALAGELLITSRGDLKLAVRKAADHIAAHPATDRRGLFWQIVALEGAIMAEIHVAPEVKKSLGDALIRIRAEQPFSVAAVASANLATILRDRRRPEVPVDWILGLPPSRMDEETAALVSWTAWKIDGNKGPKWKAWIATLGAWLGPQQLKNGCGAGAWPAEGTSARLRRAVLGGIAQQFYYAR